MDYTFHCTEGFSQDEGVIIKKGQVAKGKIFYFNGGPSFRFGNNKSDYSGGLNLEVGFLKPVGRVLSIGPSISFSKFNYDESISNSFSESDADGNNVFIDFYDARVVYMEGGDLKFFSIGFNLKVNFIPISESTNFSVYGIVKPFVLLSKRTEISATSKPYSILSSPGEPDYPGDPATWIYNGPDDLLSPETAGYERWANDTEFSGGINTGIGAEYTLSAGVTFFLQGTLVLTLPITHINTSEFPNSISGGYDHLDYPLVKKGFTSLNISVGAAYRF